MRVHGYFNENDEPALKLNLISKSIEVLIDTGFAGSLVVPQTLSNGRDGVSTGSGSDRVATDSKNRVWQDITRSLPLPVLTSSQIKTLPGSTGSISK